ncbi:MAG: DUF2480 family protein [Candidatus Neomarinimicrobiota bacterium]
MMSLYLDDYLEDGMLREASFREKINKTDWSSYSNKHVLIQGCTSAPVPTWAYLIITAELTRFTRRISYGEKRGSIRIYDHQDQ